MPTTFAASFANDDVAWKLRCRQELPCVCQCQPTVLSNGILAHCLVPGTFMYQQAQIIRKGRLRVPRAWARRTMAQVKVALVVIGQCWPLQEASMLLLAFPAGKFS